VCVFQPFYVGRRCQHILPKNGGQNEFTIYSVVYFTYPGLPVSQRRKMYINGNCFLHLFCDLVKGSSYFKFIQRKLAINLTIGRQDGWCSRVISFSTCGIDGACIGVNAASTNWLVGKLRILPVAKIQSTMWFNCCISWLGRGNLTYLAGIQIQDYVLKYPALFLFLYDWKRLEFQNFHSN